MVYPKTRKFKTREELYRFSELASKQDFPVYVSTSLSQLDARSILALFTILNQDVHIVAPDGVDYRKFEKFIQAACV